MDLSSINGALNNISVKIKTYLDKLPDIQQATFEQQQDAKYISNMYNQVVYEYSELLKLITEVQYFTSQCKKVIRLLPGNTTLEMQQKKQIKTAIEVIEEQVQPLFNEKERLKTIEMMYRAIYTRRDF